MSKGKSVRQRLKETQEFRQWKIGGIYYDRVRFGQEKWYNPELEECEFCHVKLKGLHALGCSYEQNPKYCKCPGGDYIIYCNCEPEDEGNNKTSREADRKI